MTAADGRDPVAAPARRCVPRRRSRRTHTVIPVRPRSFRATSRSARAVSPMRSARPAIAAACVRGSQTIGRARDHRPGAGFDSQEQVPDADRHGRQRPGDTPTSTVRIFDGPDTSGALVAGARRDPLRRRVVGDADHAIPAGTYTAQASQLGANGGTASARPSPSPSCRPATATTTDSSTTRTVDGLSRRCPASRRRAVVSGTVLISTRPGKGRAHDAAGPLPCPSRAPRTSPSAPQLDTAKRRIELTSAADTGGKKTQKSQFYEGSSRSSRRCPRRTPRRPRADHGSRHQGQITQSQCAPTRALVRRRPTRRRAPSSCAASCGAAARASSARRAGTAPRRSRHDLARPGPLRGHADQGTRVTVQVADFRRHKTVTVEAGHGYLARAHARGQQEGTEEVTWGHATAGPRLYSSHGRGVARMHRLARWSDCNAHAGCRAPAALGSAACLAVAAAPAGATITPIKPSPAPAPSARLPGTSVPARPACRQFTASLQQPALRTTHPGIRSVAAKQFHVRLSPFPRDGHNPRSARPADPTGRQIRRHPSLPDADDVTASDQQGSVRTRA